MVRLAFALFAVQAGFHSFTASLPLALAGAGVPDAQIGVIVGVAAAVQIPAAFLAGALIDRFGGYRLFYAGAAAYLLGALILAAPGVEPGGPLVPLLAARALQGAGIAAVIPAALSLVPSLVDVSRQGFGLSFIGSAHNLTMGVLPPISLAILAATSLRGVALAALGLVAAGALLAIRLPLVAPSSGQRPAAEPLEAARRRLGFAYRSAWTVPLVITVLYVAHWGVIVAYLPQRAELAAANVGLFFTADAVAILALRIPTGWLADRVGPRLLMLAGLGVTLAALALLLVPPTTPLLVVSGVGTGAGGGLMVSPLLLELSRRSTGADRGSAFALFSVAFAVAMTFGSIGAAPIVALGGFVPAMLAGITGVVAAGVLTVLDPSLSDAAVRARRLAITPPVAGPAADGPGIVEVPSA